MILNMYYLTFEKDLKRILYFGYSKIMGETLVLFKKEKLSECNLTSYHEYVATLKKDELGNPILPELGATTVQVDESSELGRDIRAYLQENGDDTITELLYDLENQKFNIDQEARNQRLKNHRFEQYRDNRNSEIRSAQDRIDQNLREKRMGKAPTLTDEQISILDQYIQDWVDFKENLDPEHPVAPERPDFL